MTTLRQTAKFLSGGTPSKSNASYWTGSVPWVSGKDMKQFLLEDTEDHISEEAASDGSKIAPPGSTLLLVRGMSLHDEIRACFIERPMAFNQDVKAIVPLPGVEPAFLAYSVEGRKEELLELVDSASHGTGRILTPALEQLEMYLPEISEQRKISECLHSIDRRIVLNEKLNAALEATAAAVFKSWFVDFDPVVAKSEGRKPFGMTDAIAALFPDCCTRNGLPEGWKPGKVRDLLTLSKQQCNPMNAGAEFFEHYSIPAFDSVQEPVLELGSSIKSNKFVVPSRCILVSKLNPTTPRIWWPQESSPVPRICSTEFMVAVPKAGIPQSYCFALSSSADVNDQLCGLVTGTSNSHQRVKPDDFLDLPVSLPTGELLAAFDTVVGPLYARRLLNQKQNRALRNLRDAILPGLVSGELQIKEVQREIAGAVG